MMRSTPSASCATICSMDKRGKRALAPAAVGEQAMRIGNGGFAPLYGYIHVSLPRLEGRLSAAAPRAHCPP